MWETIEAEVESECNLISFVESGQAKYYRPKDFPAQNPNPLSYPNSE